MVALTGHLGHLCRHALGSQGRTLFVPMLVWAVGALAVSRLSPTMSTISCASHLSGKLGGWYVLL
jgi:hypothetical protein